jgi:hypothetical protein
LGEDWEVIPEQLFDSERKPLLAGPVRVSPRIGFQQEWKDAFLRLTSLPGAQARGETMTGSSDLLLELRAYNSLGKPVFQIGAERIVALDQGLELQVFGPRFTPGSSQTPR